MRLNALDRLIGVFAPASALERGEARARLDASTGGYIGGKIGRRATRWWRPGNASADADVLPDLPELRSRSRDLVRNTPVATGAVSTVVTNVVGSGLQLQASIDRESLGLSEESADAWERAAEREWWLWCQGADHSRVQTFDELQALVLRSVLESGDCVVLRRWRQDPGDVYGTKLQLVEADRLSNPDNRLDSATLVAGVEVDGNGVHVAYHIASRHPGSLPLQKTTWERVPARSSAGLAQVLHLYDRVRPEQTRGVPYLAPIIELVHQLGRYSDAEVSAAVVAALYTAFIETDAEDSSAPIAGETGVAGLAENEVKLEAGAVISLAPGEKVSMPNPGRPNANFEAFVQALLRMIGVALELPYELVIKHFTASYSASRAALETAWLFFRRRRGWLQARLCQIAYEWMLEEAIALGRLSAPGFFADPLIRQAYAGAEWIGPSRISLDPKKEAEADRIDIDTGVKTREQVCLERTGGQFEDKHRQLAKEQAMRNEAGLITPPAPAGASSGADSAGDPSNVSDSTSESNE